MADNGAEPRDARKNELVYETRATQLRQRIEQLITMYADIEAEADDLHPTIHDDNHQLDQLEHRILNNINNLQPLRVNYEQAVAEWNQLLDDHGITTTDTPWTRSMYAARKKCLNVPANRPSLTTKIQMLTQTFNDIADNIGNSVKHSLHVQQPTQPLKQPRPVQRNWHPRSAAQQHS